MPADDDAHDDGAHRLWIYDLSMMPVHSEDLREELRRVVREEQGPLRECIDGWHRQQQQLLEEHGIYLQKLLEQRGLLQNRGFAPSHDGFQDSPSAGQEHSTPTETPQASKQRPAWQPDAGREPAPPGGFKLREQLEGILPQATPRTSRSEGQFSDVMESENSLGRPEESFHPMQACGDFEGLEVCHSKSSAADSDSDDSTRETAREEWARHLKQSVTQNLGRRARPRMRRSRSSAWMPARYLLLLQPSEHLVKVVESPTFQAGCASIIVVNSLWIGYTANVGMTNSLLTPPVPDPAWHEDVSTVFLVVYVIEMAFRLFAYRRSFFVGSAWKWNAFDSVLVLSAISETAISRVDLGSLRIMRGLRMARVLRILRVMRVFRDLRLMAFSIMQSLSSLSWALLLLLIIMYLFGVIFMQGVILHLRGGEEVEFAFIRQGAQTWFNSIFTTMYTLLAGITGGVNWVDVVQPLAEISVAYQVLYVVYTVFVVIGVLNVLTGIFVERASELNDLDRDLVIASQMRRNEAFLVEMKRIFEEADADGSGSICWEEFKKYLQDDRVKAYLATQQLDAFDARLFFDILTEGKSDELTIEDFLVGCQRLKGMARSVELVAVLQETRAMHRRLKVVSRALGAVGHGVSRAPTMELRRVGSMSSLASARSSSASKGSSIFA
mmetsp:Transcript_107219/g.345961  ORF Transcript_107219/g.345961 Transcript_107219/m.345961 type:complete len:668 (+) Transcript_107219:52-2055(+)